MLSATGNSCYMLHENEWRDSELFNALKWGKSSTSFVCCFRCHIIIGRFQSMKGPQRTACFAKEYSQKCYKWYQKWWPEVIISSGTGGHCLHSDKTQTEHGTWNHRTGTDNIQFFVSLWLWPLQNNDWSSVEMIGILGSIINLGWGSTLGKRPMSRCFLYANYVNIYTHG